MKAAVCYEFGQPLVVEDVEIEAPHRGEVKVRLAATAICHSDVHLIHGPALPYWVPVPAGGLLIERCEELDPVVDGGAVHCTPRSASHSSTSA